MIKIPQHIIDLQTYKAGKPIEELQREKGLNKIVKLASNENPLGPSPKAIIAIQNALTELHRYSDPACFRLINAICKKYNVHESQVFCASGSDAIIQYIVNAFSKEDDALLSSEGTFIGWYVNVNKLGRQSINTPLKNYSFNLEALTAKINVDTKIIYLANPNNPTGTMFSKNDFVNFMSNVPESILVVLDEAYTLYAQDHPGYPNGLDYDYPNLLVLRTLSKSYGLAGIRLGFCFGDPKLISALNKVRLPFEPNVLAQEAAIAALNDEEFLIKTSDLNKVSLSLFKTKFDELGIEYTNSFANFLMLIFDNEDFASSFTELCTNEGLIVRHIKSFGIPNGVRINSGTIDETEFAIKVIDKIYKYLKT
jgi:histidinol-phosphate aminotransferase